MPFEPAPKTEEQQRVQMGRIALEAIAAHILTVPPENFDMSQWCGTAQCAIGNTIHLPAVAATGLELREDYLCGTHQQKWPCFGNERGPEAIAAAFGISRYDAHDLFASYKVSQLTQAGVSQRIREYLVTGEIR